MKTSKTKTIFLVIALALGLGGGAAYASDGAVPGDKDHGNAFGKTQEMIQARIDGNVAEVVHKRVLLKQEKNAERHDVKLREVKAKVEKKLKTRKNNRKIK